MTDKQIIIDYKNLCENYNKEVGCFGTFDGSCIKEQCFTYKLLQQLQAKEQEYVELRGVIRKDICSHYVLGECSQKHHNNCVGRSQCIKDLEQQLDQLKAENEELKETIQRHDNDNNALLKEVEDELCEYYRRHRECLTEIKEIAETASKRLYATMSNDYTDGYSWLGSIILQKISECEVE